MPSLESERGSADRIRGEPSLSVCILAGMLPVGGGKLEDPAARPPREQGGTPVLRFASESPATRTGG